VYRPRTLLTPGYQGTLGYEYGTALGAQVGAPAQRALAVCGDGGFMYQVQELATAVRHRINVIAVVFNDNAYGNVWRTQKRQYGGHVIGSELHNPDFMKLAAAFGVNGLRADGPEGLRAQLAAALSEDYRRRAVLFAGILANAPRCRVTPPEGGMFVLLDVRGTGLGSEAFARALLAEEGVAALPADGFGPSAVGQLRLALTHPDERLAEAARRIVRLAERLAAGAAA
jgi:hypothetical protein